MPAPPVTHIDPAAFRADPYPALAHMRREAPVTFVPELGAVLVTRRADVHRHEKRVDVLSSRQPQGLMTRLMGENLMRKDGEAHMAERRALFPALSPRTVREHWLPLMRRAAEAVLEDLAPRGEADLVTDYAMPVSAHALRHITGLTLMAPGEMDRVSQGMLDGCANYAGDAEVEARCHDCTASIDRHVDAQVKAGCDPRSVLGVQLAAGLPEPSVRANVKLVISGGQNEPRDAIAGTLHALLSHPEAMEAVRSGRRTHADAFAEYARWVSPIGMSPREVARRDDALRVDLEPGQRVFLMFGSANRDEAAFEDPDLYDIDRDAAAAIPFGAGPHFCAGAAASRALIADVALPMAFERLPWLRLAGPVPYAGWAFRGPTSLPAAWG